MDYQKLEADLAQAREEHAALSTYIAGLEQVLGMRSANSRPSQAADVVRSMAKGEAYAAVKRVLEAGGEHRPSTIARVIGTSPNSVSHVLRKMRERGLVEEAGFGVYRWKAAA